MYKVDNVYIKPIFISFKNDSCKLQPMFSVDVPCNVGEVVHFFYFKKLLTKLI